MPLKGASARGRDQSRPIADETLAVTDAAAGLASIPGTFTYAFIEVQDQPLRVRFLGDPTSAVGHFYAPGQTDVWNPVEVRAARMIRTTGTNAAVFVTYYVDG